MFLATLGQHSFSDSFSTLIYLIKNWFWAFFTYFRPQTDRQTDFHTSALFFPSPPFLHQCYLHLVPFIISHLYLFPDSSVFLPLSSWVPLSTPLHLPPSTSLFPFPPPSLQFSSPSITLPFLSPPSTSRLPLSCPDSLCRCGTVIITALAIDGGRQGGCGVLVARERGGGVVRETWEAVAVETKRLCEWGMEG